MRDALGGRMTPGGALCTLGCVDVIGATIGGDWGPGIPFAFDAATIRMPVRDSLREAWPKPRTTVIAND